MRAPRTERADVEAIRTQRDGKRRVVELGVMGQGDYRRTMVRPQPLKRFIRPFLGQFDTGKTRFRCERAARVDDGDTVIRELQHLNQWLSYVYSADHKATAGRAKDLDKYPGTSGVQRRVPVAPQGGACRGERRGVKLQLAFRGTFVDQQLPAVDEISRQCDRVTFAARFEDRVEQVPFHSTRSTKI